MNIQKDYDVLRLIEHNRICYVSSDNVKGCPLVHWLKYHPYLEKEQMIYWIYIIIQQLTQIHKCRGNPCYQYVNPYSIIVTEDEKLCFLDIGADSNKDRIRLMQRRNIREYFLPEKEGGYQRGSVELDIYGLGKTIQYLLTFVDVEPELTRKEEKKMKNLITRCISGGKRRRFEKMSEVLNYLTELKAT